MFDTSLQDNYFSNAMGFGGQFSNAGSAQNVSGSPGSGGFIGGIISSIHNGVFDWVNLSENRKIQRQNLENARRQIDYQYDFAKNGIGWRVADAKKNGIHPLYALGANTPTYTPVDMSQSPVNYKVRNPYESFIQGQSSVLALENQKLQNELLRSQIDSNDLQNSQISNHMDNADSANDIEAIVTNALDSKFSGNGQYSGFGLDAEGWKQFLQEYASENPIRYSLVSYLDRLVNHPDSLKDKKLDSLGVLLGVPRLYDESKGERSYFDALYQPREVLNTLKDWGRFIWSLNPKSYKRR